METQELDDLADDDAVIAHRARAKAGPGQMARQAKQALADAGIDLSLFFLWIALDAVRGHVQLSTQLMISSRSTGRPMSSRSRRGALPAVIASDPGPNSSSTQ